MLFVIAVADGVFPSGFTLIHDTMIVAEHLRVRHDRAIPEITVVVAGEEPMIRTASGVLVPTTIRPQAAAGADVVIVPAVGEFDEAGVIGALTVPAVARMTETLAGLAGSGVMFAGACSGTFAMAEAGLLDGHRATTSWWLEQAFRSRYPTVDLDSDRMLVRDRDTMTAGAAYAHVDLALALVRMVSVELADRVARHLLIDRRAAQSTYVAIDHIRRSDALVQDFERHVRSNLRESLPVAAISRALGTTPRTLERRVRAAAEMTPVELIHRIRVERAEHLLATTEQSIDQVAADVGYHSGATLRALLRRYRHRPGQPPYA